MIEPVAKLAFLHKFDDFGTGSRSAQIDICDKSADLGRNGVLQLARFPRIVFSFIVFPFLGGKMAINATIHFVTGLIQEVIPYAIQSAFQAGFQDPRVGRVVSGAVFVATGACLVAKSGIRKTLPSWCWGKGPPVQGTTKKVTSCALALCGLTAICFGVYQVARGIFSPPDPAEISYRVPSSQKLCEGNLEKTRTMMLECPFSEELAKEAEKQGGPFSLKCGPVTAVEIGPSSSTISVKRDQRSDSQPYHVLVEMGNVKRSKRYTQLSDTMCSIEPNEYARQLQTFEYGSHVEAVGIFDKCVEERFWPESLSSTRDRAKSEMRRTARNTDVYLAALSKQGKTADLEKQWHARCDKKEL